MRPRSLPVLRSWCNTAAAAPYLLPQLYPSHPLEGTHDNLSLTTMQRLRSIIRPTRGARAARSAVVIEDPRESRKLRGLASSLAFLFPERQIAVYLDASRLVALD